MRRAVTSLVLGCWLLLAGAWTVRLADTAKDDFFITYAYGRNLAAGHGLVFNPGERVFGLSEPGLALLLAGLHLATDVSIPWLGTLLTAVGLLATCLLITREASASGRLAEGLAGGTLVLATSLQWSDNGGGWALVLPLLALSGTFAARRPVLAGLGAGLAVWMRPDAGLGVAGLALLEWWRRRRPPWGLAGAAAGLIAAGGLLAWLYFGRMLPATFEAKLAMAGADPGAWSGAVRFWSRLVFFLPRHLGAHWPWLAVLAVPGVVAWARGGGQGTRTIALYAAALAIFYPASGLPFFSWYVKPCLLAALYGVAFGAGWIARIVAGWRWPHGVRLGVSGLVAAAVAALVATSALSASYRWYRSYTGYPHQQTYRRAALWIAAHTPPSDRIAYVEIGEVGYWSERRVRDLMGLVTPEALPYVRADDIVGAFLLEPTEIVLFHSRGRMGPIVSAPWFQQAFEEIGFFPDRLPSRNLRRGLSVLRRKSGAILPEPRRPATVALVPPAG